jgi:phosphomannomutase
MTLACFKAYDIRGRIPDELNPALAKRIGMAFAHHFKPKKLVVGRDMRLSSPEMTDALVDGLLEMGVDVLDIGLSGTELVYFGAFHLEDCGVDGGIVVTASHNPADYNGMKLVTTGARPVSNDTGLKDIEALVESGTFAPAKRRGMRRDHDIWPAYIEHLLSYVDFDTLRPLTIVSNPGNGCAGLVVERIEALLPHKIIKVHHTPDGTFPHGVPNPLLEENRAPTIDAVRREKADLGLAWDGDFDRCFFFDSEGAFIEGYYMVGLLAEELLRRSKGSAVIHDPRLVWNTVEMVEAAGGRAVMSKTGHAFIKERMRKEDAVYGGEMSAHHYFKDFAYCDSGMIPWLLVANVMGRTGKTLQQLVFERMARFPCSGEINRKVKDGNAAIARVKALLEPLGPEVDTTDGLSFTFADWRANVRMSNTEPTLRLNVETRGDPGLLDEKTRALLAAIDAV